MDDKGDLTPSDRAWLNFLRENSRENDPEMTLRFVRLLQRICELRRSQNS